MGCKQDACWECGERDAVLHTHHPVPRSLGGKRTITLCLACHTKAHHEDTRMGTGALSKTALASKRARGGRTSRHAPLGTRIGEDGCLEPNPREVEAVILARTLRNEGVTLRAIAQRLMEEGFETRGKRWYASSIRRMLADGALDKCALVMVAKGDDAADVAQRLETSRVGTRYRYHDRDGYLENDETPDGSGV